MANRERTRGNVRSATRRRGRVSLGLALLVVLLVAGLALTLVRRASQREIVVRTPGIRPGGVPPRPAPASKRPTRRQSAPGLIDTVAAFEGCPVVGDGGDRALNRLKNRTEEGQYQAVTIAELLAMRWPVEIGGRYRERWPARAVAAVAPNEARAVRVEGYLVMARASGPESTNCHGEEPRFRDYHLWLTEAPLASRATSVVAEMTPRLRALHANWNLDVLSGVVRRRERVRVSGWLLLDQEHPDQIGKTRGTIWEIHPVTHFEVQRDGRWLSLDDVAFARGAGRSR